jgi:hypothetical protein
MNVLKFFTPNRIFLGLIVLSVVILAVYLGIQTRIDPLEAAMAKEGQIGTLFVIHEKGKILFSESVFFHTATGKIFIVDIPVETGALIASLGKVAALSDLYQVNDSTAYRELVQGMLGQNISFVFSMELNDVERTIDFLGGLNLLVSEPLEIRSPDQLILVPSGNVTLEGPKVVQFLKYQDQQEVISDRIDRYQRFMRAFLRQLGDESLWLINSNALRYLLRYAFSGYEEDGMRLFLSFLGKADLEGVALLQVFGTTREVDGRKLLFPHFNGNLLREGVAQATKAIESSDQESLSTIKIKIEIMNGTERAGLASRTASIFQSVGIDVVRVSNADNRNYVNTLILDRKGKPAAVQRVSQLIRATNIRSDVSTLNEASDVDLTLILGMDFDGRYVRQ